MLKYLPMTETSGPPSVHLSRRSVIAGAAAIGVTSALAACGSDPEPASSGTGTGTTKTVSASQVPVGGAAIVGDVVVSQPTAGSYKAFSAVCTHQNCVVSRVEGTKITCPCHGSQFSATDGSVITGPANRALIAKTVTPSGDTLTIT
jgi:Rieske Fe-S protein